MAYVDHITHIKLTDEELEAYRRYLAGSGPIQECLPTVNRVGREFLKSGYCVKCQKPLFNNEYAKRLY